MRFIKNITGSTIHIRNDDGIPVCRASKNASRYVEVNQISNPICSSCAFHKIPLENRLDYKKIQQDHHDKLYANNVFKRSR